MTPGKSEGLVERITNNDLNEDDKHILIEIFKPKKYKHNPQPETVKDFDTATPVTPGKRLHEAARRAGRSPSVLLLLLLLLLLVVVVVVVVVLLLLVLLLVLLLLAESAERVGKSFVGARPEHNSYLRVKRVQCGPDAWESPYFFTRGSLSCGFFLCGLDIAIHIYIYIYIERERESDRSIYVIYIYI